MKLQIRLGTLFTILLFGAMGWLWFSLNAENDVLRQSIKNTKIANMLLVIEDPTKVEFIRHKSKGMLVYLPDNGTKYVLCFRNRKTDQPTVIPITPGEHEIEFRVASLRGSKRNIRFDSLHQLRGQLEYPRRSARKPQEVYGAVAISVDGKEMAICHVDDRAFWFPMTGSHFLISRPNWSEHQFPEALPIRLLGVSRWPEGHSMSRHAKEIPESVLSDETRWYLTIEDSANHPNSPDSNQAKALESVE